MTTLPQSMEAALSQAVDATKAAIADQQTRLLVEFNFPELKAMPIAEKFLRLYPDLGENVKVFFADAGAAALATRDWTDLPYTCLGVKEFRNPIAPEDDAIVMVETTAVEIGLVEKLCNDAGDRPCIIINPQLQDVSIVGIGYAGRMVRERFISTLVHGYYIRPLPQGALKRAYPEPWQVWWEDEPDSGDFKLIAEQDTRPTGEDLDKILMSLDAEDAPPKKGLLQNLQQFLNALSQ